jgi:hypothetical protein
MSVSYQRATLIVMADRFERKSMSAGALCKLQTGGGGGGEGEGGRALGEGENV